MKKQYLLLAFSIFSFTALNAQITIVSDDIKPLNVVATQTDDGQPDLSITPGGAGEQNWDFSALQNNGDLTFSFIDPAGTPYAAIYPNANVASSQADNYFYFTQSADDLVALGTYGDFIYQGATVTTAIVIDPPQSLLRFPATLGDSYTETVVQKAQAPGSAVGLPYDSVRIEREVVRSVNIDAYGMLTTPIGTFETIRSTEVENTTDNFYILSFNNWSLLTSDGPNESTIYNWWTQEGNFGFPAVQLQADETGAVTGANWLTSFVSDAEEKFDLKFGLYPNPAPTSVFVEFPEFFAGSLEVVDLNGQTVFQQTVSNIREEVSTQNFTAGNYVMVIRNADGGLAAAKRFQVVR